MRRRAMGFASGFTLLEVVIAVAVLAILAGLSVRGMSAILDTQARADADAHRWNDLALVAEQMSRDFSLALSSPLIDSQGQLQLTRLGDADAPPAESGVRRVGYRLREGAVEYLRWPQNAPADAPPQAQRVLEAVAGLRFRILGVDGSWRPLEAAPADNLPLAVEAQLELGAGERITRLFPLR